MKQRELLGPDIAGIQFGSQKQDPAGLLRLFLQITPQTRETADAIGHRGPMLSLKFELIELRDEGTMTSTDSS